MDWKTKTKSIKFCLDFSVHYKKPKGSQLENTQYKTQSTECIESGTLHAGVGNSTETDANSRVGHNSSKNKTDPIFSVWTKSFEGFIFTGIEAIFLIWVFIASWIIYAQIALK